MLHTERDPTDGQLQPQCYTQGVTLLHTEHLRCTTTDGQLQLQTQCYTGRDATTNGTLKTDKTGGQLQPQNQYYTGRDATTHGTLKMDNNRQTATATESILHRA